MPAIGEPTFSPSSPAAIGEASPAPPSMRPDSSIDAAQQDRSKGKGKGKHEDDDSRNGSTRTHSTVTMEQLGQMNGDLNKKINKNSKDIQELTSGLKVIEEEKIVEIRNEFTSEMDEQSKKIDKNSEDIQKLNSGLKVIEEEKIVEIRTEFTSEMDRLDRKHIQTQKKQSKKIDELNSGLKRTQELLEGFKKGGADAYEEINQRLEKEKKEQEDKKRQEEEEKKQQEEERQRQEDEKKRQEEEKKRQEEEKKRLEEERQRQEEEAEDQRRDESLECKLPDKSAYTAALVAILIFSCEDARLGGCWTFLGVKASSFMSLALSIAAQSFVIYILQQESNAIINKCEDPFNDECPCELKLNGVLQLIGAGAFLSEMLVDVEESVQMAMWLWYKNQLNQQDNGSRSSVSLCGENELKVEGKTHTFYMSWKRRLVAFVLCVVPKLVVIFFLTWFGTRFVLLAENNVELLLNCVALNFVIAFDEAAHKRLSPKLMTNIIKKLPSAEVHGGRLNCLDKGFGFIGKFVVWAGSVIGLRFEAYGKCGCWDHW